MFLMIKNLKRFFIVKEILELMQGGFYQKLAGEPSRVLTVNN